MEACNKRIFKGLSLDDGPNISLLQYADDALFFGEWSVANARNLMCILELFHDVSGLNINLAKSRIFGIGIPMADVANIVRAINFSYGSLPFNYLGLPVDKKDGGIGIRSIKAKNMSLLSKWRLRYLNETGALWRKVISKIHGSDGGFEAVSGSRQKGGVWSSIIGCCSELNQMGISLRNLMAWSRHPNGRVLDELSCLSCLINGLVLDMSRKDNWSWSLDESGSFSVRSLCKTIQSNLFVIGIDSSSFK
ncbi:RNA-directed DNA polymerase, eukaryota, reverse transcriptase zinc-binding domain protein [Tanacetum coccineum]